MFSRRTPASLEPNHLTESLARLRERGNTWIDLTLSNPTQAGLAYPAREILEALQDPRMLTYEPVPFGLEQTRQAVSHYYAERGLPAAAENIVLSASTSEAYSWLFKLLCEPGDRVLVPAPSYPLFECLASLEAVETAQYPLEEERQWGIDFDALQSAWTKQVRALVIVNPNNPTGTYLRPDEWAKLQGWAAERQLALIVDEVFLDYGWTEGVRPFSALSAPAPALTFTLSGLSKIAALPQMKLGWMVVGGPQEERTQALERLEWIADSFLPVSAPVQYATPRWLSVARRLQDAIRARCRFNLTVLRNMLAPETGCRVLPAQGGWMAVLDVPRMYSEEAWVLKLAAQAGVLAQPGFFYDFPREALLVLSLLPQEAVFAEGVKRLIGCFRSV